MKEKIDYLLFKCLFDAIAEQYWEEKIALAEYHHRIKRISQIQFFGFNNYDPFPRGGGNYPATTFPKNLKSEFLKHPHILKILAAYYQDLGESSWDRLKNDPTEGLLKGRYPDMQKTEISTLEATIKAAGITESMFVHIAENFNNKTLRDWYAKFVLGEAEFKRKAAKSIDARNLTIYAIYGGFNGIEDLKNAAEKQRRIAKKKRRDKTVQFTGYYYNIIEHDIFEKLTLTVEVSPKAEIRAEIQGNNIYKGTAEVVENTLYLNLVNFETKHHLYLILHINNLEDIKNQHSIRGALMGISKGVILSSEIILVGASIELNNEQTLNIKRYLYWHRRTFRTNRTPFLLNEIKVRNHAVDQYENICGVWKMWNFDELYNVSESLLWINPDYKIEYFYFNNKGKFTREQGSFDISKDRDRNIILFSTLYPFGNQEAQGHLFIKVPRRRSIEATEGLLINYQNKDTISSYRALILKRSDRWGNHITRESSPNNDLEGAIKEDLKLYSRQKIISELVENRDKAFTRLFNQLSYKSLNHTPPHWILSFLKYESYYTSQH